jgi:BirA family transcriptional regulator, biotin operon repressor / biotin---[acetyl-CoA-carboxylase] ligase
MIGSPRVHHRLTDSTNERAKELALAGAPHGTLVTADEQTAGRGRQGREWTAPPRSAVLMSVVLRELDEMLPLAAAVAVAEAVPVEAAIKWPNDIWIDGRKVAGILVEGRPQEGWAVLGVGLNVSTEAFPAELAEYATSLYLSGIEGGVEAVLRNVLSSLDRWLGAPPARVLEAWRSRDALKGERVRWTGGDGVANGIDDSGALVVETSGGLVTLDAGEVHLRR